MDIPIGNASTALQSVSGLGHDIAVRQVDPLTTAIVMLIGALVSLLGGLISVITAVIGATTQPAKPVDLPHAGEAWTFWMYTGMEGVGPPGKDPLKGPGGPYPDVLAYDASGRYIGTNHETTKYAYASGLTAFPIWPNSKNDVAQPAYLQLTWPYERTDPVCVVEFGVSKKANDEAGKHGGFNAVTAKACAAAQWYHSGTTEEWGLNETAGGMPCIWLDHDGTRSIQIHLPSHRIVGNRQLDKVLNGTRESKHEYFCNTPGRMSFNDDHPKRNEMHKRLIRDYEKTGEITLEQTLEKLNKSSEWHGQPNPGALADRAVHADTLSIGYRNVPGRLAEELCEHGMSWGPDWVNELEGKFCDMAEKKLYPVCSQDIKDDCFDMGLKDVVRGGVAKRSMPYSKELSFL